MTHNPKMKLKDIRDYDKNVKQLTKEMKWLWFFWVPLMYPVSVAIVIFIYSLIESE